VLGPGSRPAQAVGDGGPPIGVGAPGLVGVVGLPPGEENRSAVRHQALGDGRSYALTAADPGDQSSFAGQASGGGGHPARLAPPGRPEHPGSAGTVVARGGLCSAGREPSLW